MDNAKLDLPRLTDGTDQQGEVIVHAVDDDLTRQIAFLAAEVVLGKKRRQHLAALLLDGHLGEEVLAAQHAPAAHADQVHASAPRIDDGGHYINVTRTTFHALLVLHTPQQGHLVAQFGGTLKFKRLRRRLHCAGQLVRQSIAAPFQEHH